VGKVAVNSQIKFERFPDTFIQGTCVANPLRLDGGAVMESSTHCYEEEGYMFLQEHLLLMLLEGEFTYYYGDETFELHPGEMILFQKNTQIRYKRVGNHQNADRIDCLMFAIKDDLLREFLSAQQGGIEKDREDYANGVCRMDDHLIAAVRSLRPFFGFSSDINPGLIRLKVMEILYDVMSSSMTMFRRILQLRQPVKTDIHRVVEQNYTSPITLEELAYLSGRSLSSFKRDFQGIYNETPAKWIRERRLDRACHMLKETSMTVADVCYAVGYENPNHFSRLFKNRYGYAPSEARESGKED
jgi:AraC-like DNA-binding protein